MLNGTQDLWVVTVLPAFGILGVNLLFESKVKGNPGLFSLSIILQILIITAAFLVQDVFSINYFDLINHFKSDKNLVLKLFSVIVCLTPANLIIRVILDKYLSPNSGILMQEDIHKNLNTKEASYQDSLQRAGRLIGNIERILTIGLLYAGQYEAIGFLIAAKSIIRTKELKSDSEYILIGTLLSFGFAILVGLIIQHLSQV